MKKIALYLHDTGKRVDCRNIFEGNPGMGGTEFEFVLLAAYLSRDFKHELEIVVLNGSDNILPEYITEIKLSPEDTLVQLWRELYSHKIDALLLDARDLYKIVKCATDYKVNLIPWIHCFSSSVELKMFAKNPLINNVVCVGHHQALLLQDLKCYKKVSTIFNSVILDKRVQENALSKPAYLRPNNVTFMGALDSCKAFHHLAKAWKFVLREVPDAQLHVIGSGCLYSSKVKVGKLGLADCRYEKLFYKHVTDENGNIIPSIHFHGVLGVEKNDILLQTKVGVTALGRSDTFGIVAVELQNAGTYMVANRQPGHLDVCFPKITRFSSTTPRKLANAIVAQLKRTDDCFSESIDFLTNNFSPEVIMPQWVKLLKGEKQCFLKRDDDVTGIYKLVKINAVVRKIFPFIPSVMFIWKFKENVLLYCNLLLEKLHLKNFVKKLLRR